VSGHDLPLTAQGSHGGLGVVVSGIAEMPGGEGQSGLSLMRGLCAIRSQALLRAWLVTLGEERGVVRSNSPGEECGGLVRSSVRHGEESGGERSRGDWWSGSTG
jgi:hypothetical protein